jgi:uncharacterized protein (PEP-CTERM system associated)
MPLAQPRFQAQPTRLALLLCLAGLLIDSAAWAQDGGARRLSVSSSVSIGQTLTDNHRAETSGVERSEAITTLGAGLRVSARGARLQGSLNYGLTGLMYARDTKANDLQNRLQAGLQTELIERHFFVNAQASISQSPISALAQQTADGVTNTRNRTEVTTVRLLPTLRGSIAGEVDVEAGLSLSATDTGGAESTSDSTNAGATLSLASSRGGLLGWSLQGSRQVVDFKQGRQTESDLLVLGLNLRPDVDWLFTLRGGYEANDFRRADGKDRYDTWGAGVAWTPSPRTRVTLDGDKRSFGHAHALALEHRMRRAVFRYSDSQSVNDGAGSTAQGLIGAYELFFDLFASQEPDPILREQLVDVFLANNNLQRDSQISTGFLTSAVTLQRRQELSLALQGRRSTVLMSAFGTDSNRVDTVSTGVDDTLNDGRVRQRGLNFSVNHRLTPTGAVNLRASIVRSSNFGGLRTDLRSVSAAWTDRLGRRTTYSLGYRHSEYDADLNPYVENALTANLSLQF